MAVSLTIGRNLQPPPGAGAGPAVHREQGAEVGRQVPHDPHPEVALLRFVEHDPRIEADPVVDDLQPDVGPDPGDADTDALRPGVPAGIAQALLGHAVDERLALLAQRQVLLDPDRDVHPGRGQRGSQVAQRGP